MPRDPRPPCGTSAVEPVEVLVEDEVRQLAVADGLDHAVVLAREVAPRQVGGEQHAVAADAAPLDLLGEPVRSEPDRPGAVRVDLLAGLDPVEEPLADQLDVTAQPATEVDQVNRYLVAVLVPQLAELVDVRLRTRRGVNVDDEVVGLGGGEDLVELDLA